MKIFAVFVDKTCLITRIQVPRATITDRGSRNHWKNGKVRVALNLELFANHADSSNQIDAKVYSLIKARECCYVYKIKHPLNSFS